jgi:hypothetical protein
VAGGRSDVDRPGRQLQNYIGISPDVAGEPDAELSTSPRSRRSRRRPAPDPGRCARRRHSLAGEALRTSPNGNLLDFVAHGMGLISHEARLTDAAPVPIGDDAGEPLRPAWCRRRRRCRTRARAIKIEDTVVVTEDGWEAFGDGGRGWNRRGPPPRREPGVQEQSPPAAKTRIGGPRVRRDPSRCLRPVASRARPPAPWSPTPSTWPCMTSLRAARRRRACW